jgi:hypothetical protein
VAAAEEAQGGVKEAPTIRAVVELDVENIASDWSQDGAFDFVVALDSAMQDWSFTLRVYEHFAAQKAECEREEAEDAARLAARMPK